MNILDHFVLGLFPTFQNGRVGGIEESGRLGWNSITAIANGELISYSNLEASEFGAKYPTRLRTILDVLKISSQPHTVLVWHVGLLKLVPFIRQHPAKVFLFLHGIETWKQPDWLTRRLLKRVDVFLTNSEFTWLKFLDYNLSFQQSQHIRVSLGIGDTSELVEVPRDSPPAALMLSRLATTEDYKGHREVIDAWPMVLKTIPSAELWIAGDGDLRARLERQAEALGLKNAIKFRGKVSEEQKQELLHRCRCLVMPSRGEGFGLVYLEAMRVGRPCLVSTLDAGREVVNPPEAGLAADPHNRDAVAKAICRLIDDGPEWQQWSEQARRRYERNYTAKHFQDRLVAALFPEKPANYSERN
jgi:phosphatidyl-myo-inositol dimannoside synthase